MKVRRVVIASTLAVGIIASAILFAPRWDGVYRTKERRIWKDDAINEIRSDLADPKYLSRRLGATPRPLGEFEMSEPNWLTSETMVFRDGTWLAYRAQTHKVDPKVHDIFIAKASDGNWYYSDYHFCVGMMVIDSEDQPESLDYFKDEYRLAQFDGASDDALNPTIKINGEQGGGGDP